MGRVFNLVRSIRSRVRRSRQQHHLLVSAMRENQAYLFPGWYLQRGQVLHYWRSRFPSHLRETRPEGGFAGALSPANWIIRLILRPPAYNKNGHAFGAKFLLVSRNGDTIMLAPEHGYARRRSPHLDFTPAYATMRREFESRVPVPRFEVSSDCEILTEEYVDGSPLSPGLLVCQERERKLMR